MDIININFISFGSIIACSFTLLTGLYLFLLPGKSKATLNLSLSFLFISMLSASYIYTFSVYHYTGAYHRWVSVASVLPGTMYMSQFLFYFPDERRVSVARWFFRIQWAVIIMVTAFWIYLTCDGKTIVFRPDGQNWDLNHPAAQPLSLIIMANILLIPAVGLWRAIVAKGNERLAVIAITLSLMTVTMLPGVGNSLIRHGVWSSSLYHTVYDICTVIGWFITIIVYLNVTRDRTTFMAKIVVVSLATMLTLLLFIGYFTINDREKTYDLIHREQMTKMIYNRDYAEPDLEYLVSYRNGGSSFKELVNRDNASVHFDYTVTGNHKWIKPDNKTVKHYRSFTYYDNNTGTLYEAGYSFFAYRSYINEASVKLLIIWAAILVIVLGGYRIFFHFALIRPLMQLIEGHKLVEAGDFSVQIPVQVVDEIGFLTRSFNQMASTIRTAKQKIDEYTVGLENMVKQRTAELEKARDELWGEMKLAKKIQTILLPASPGVPGYEVAVHMTPADQVGGDYYDIINVPGRDWIVIGDVSGHGVPAGLVMMMLQTSIRTVLVKNPATAPSKLLSDINRVLTDNIRALGEDKYITITAFACSPGGRLLFSGLHEDFLIYRSREKRVTAVKTDGMWLGIRDDIRQFMKDDEVILEIGDLLMLYTDGITEALNKNHEPFSKQKLIELFEKNSEKAPEHIKNFILAQLDSGYIKKDDVTMIILKRIS